MDDFDRQSENLLFCVLAILVYVLMISTHDSRAQYAGAFLALSGSVYTVTISFLRRVYPNVPISVAWKIFTTDGLFSAQASVTSVVLSLHSHIGPPLHRSLYKVTASRSAS